MKNFTILYSTRPYYTILFILYCIYNCILYTIYYILYYYVAPELRSKKEKLAAVEEALRAALTSEQAPPVPVEGLWGLGFRTPIGV